MGKARERATSTTDCGLLLLSALSRFLSVLGVGVAESITLLLALARGVGGRGGDAGGIR